MIIYNSIEMKNRVYELKRNLEDSDYKILKYLEGHLSEDEFNSIKVQRQLWRDEINELEGTSEELEEVEEEIVEDEEAATVTTSNTNVLD